MPTLASTLLLLYGFGTLGFVLLWWLAMCCDECCGSLFGTKQKPQQTQNKGLVRLIFGKGGGPVQGYPVQQQQMYVGQPVQAQSYGAQPAQQPAQAHPPPQQQPAGQQPGVATQAAAGGLGLAGAGLQAAGRWLGGGSKART